jgi:hypothetical protein
MLKDQRGTTLMLVKFHGLKNTGMVDPFQQEVLTFHGLASCRPAELGGLQGIGIESHTPRDLREGDVGRFPVLIDIAFRQETRQGVIANTAGAL